MLREKPEEIFRFPFLIFHFSLQEELRRREGDLINGK